MPTRLIKETIHNSEDVNRMSDFQFRLWVNLITYVDDYGRGDARPAVIKGTCFPLRERLTSKDINDALKALAGIGCVGLYEVDGKPYLYFPTWESHQSVRNKKSKFPAPPENCERLKTIENNCMQLKTNVPVIQSNPNPNPNPYPNPSISSEPQSDSEPPVAELLLNDGTVYAVWEQDLPKLEALYPAVDVAQELRNMAGWCLGNPTRRKTNRGINSFIHTWLKREQDRAHKPQSGNFPQCGNPFAEMLKEGIFDDC